MGARARSKLVGVGWSLLASSLVAVLSLISAPTRAVSGSTDLYTPKANHDAVVQVAALTSSGQKADAHLVTAMVNTPQAVWFSRGGTPASIEQDVNVVVARARNQGTPVLVAYNIPFRDCAGFSAGGATSNAEYLAWIDGFARGIGNSSAIVILEPDGLGIVPWAGDWCQPGEANPATAAADRYATLGHAIDRLKQQPGAKVYLDGTHSSWMNVEAIARRLILAGVARADGFFLNVSNYQFTANLVQYGTWISSCIALANGSNLDALPCANQWWNGGPRDVGWGLWNGVAMDPYGQWSDTSTVQSLNTANINARFAQALGGRTPTTHFVIDSSRNGQGPWNPGLHPAGDPQDWCNPPGRGLGVGPTVFTGAALVDAYLWIKIPGESDGQCNRWFSDQSSDPARGGMIDPAAGLWFPEQALELVHNASPSLP
jgi:endoglucanase